MFCTKQRERDQVKSTDIKMTVFWYVALCSLVEIDRHFRGAYCLHHKSDEFLRDYTAQHPRRQSIFILAAVRNWNLTQRKFISRLDVYNWLGGIGCKMEQEEWARKDGRKALERYRVRSEPSSLTIRKKSVRIMTTNHLNTGVEPTPETSFTSNKHQTMDDVQHSVSVMNQPLS
jgi:hypothetical protein